MKWKGFPGSSEVKASICNAGDLGLIPGSGRFPGEGNGNPLQYSCLENPMDGGAWWTIVYGITESDMTERLHFFIQPGISVSDKWYCIDSVYLPENWIPILWKIAFNVPWRLSCSSLTAGMIKGLKGVLARCGEMGVSTFLGKLASCSSFRKEIFLCKEHNPQLPYS